MPSEHSESRYLAIKLRTGHATYRPECQPGRWRSRALLHFGAMFHGNQQPLIRPGVHTV